MWQIFCEMLLTGWRCVVVWTLFHSPPLPPPPSFHLLHPPFIIFHPHRLLNVKMCLHLLNIVRVPLWLPSKADQMVTLNISKVIMLMLNCWYLVYCVFRNVFKIYLLFLIYYIRSSTFPAKSDILSNRHLSLYVKCWSLGEIYVSNCGYYGMVQ